MKHNFRPMARLALQRAKLELSSGDPERLKYAALELRMATEALTYDRAQAYHAIMPVEEYKAWQPKKVMAALLAMDPRADKGVTLMVGIEEDYGRPADEMNLLGTEFVVDLKTLKKHYDALGFYLHTPTIEQLGASHPDLNALRARCESIADAVDAALASPISNVVLSSIVEHICVRCRAVIRKHVPPGQEATEVKCLNCPASYTVSTADPHKTIWRSLAQSLSCSNCKQSFSVWKEDVREGSHWTCAGCGQQYVIGLAVLKKNAGPTTG